MPLIRREPLADGLQASLDENTGILRVVPGLPDHALHIALLEAIFVLNQRWDLTTYATRPRRKQQGPHLRLVHDRDAS